MEPIILRKGERVGLGLVEKELLPVVQRWINDPEVNRNLRSPGSPYYFEDEENWYESLRKNKDLNRVFVVYLNDTNDPVGLVGLHNINHIARHAEIGYLMSKENWGQGYGSESVSIIIQYGKEVLNLRKVFAFVNSGNERSIQVLKKNGLDECGKFKEHSLVPGSGFVDLLFFEKFL